jgi:HEAT repeat protein
MPPTPPSGPWIPAPFAPDTDLRIQALGSLIQAHPTQVIPLLKEIALDSRDPGEGRRAVFVLAQSGRPEARTTVVEVAKEAPEAVRIAAVRELGRFGSDEAGSELLQVYSLGTPRVKREVVSSLAALGTEATTGALLKIVRTEVDPQVRNIAIVTLGRTDGVRQLGALYDRMPPESRRAVLAALFAARDEDELIRIASTEREAALRQEARRQLRLLGTPRALQYLSQHPDPK